MAEVTILGIGPDPVVRNWEIGANLYHALAEDRLMDAPCGGRGRCGKCRLLIQEGDAPVNAEDRQFFTEEELDEGWRLACMQTVQGNLTLRLPPQETVGSIVSDGYLRPFDFDPVVTKQLTPDGDTEVITRGKRLAIESGDTRDRLYGVAVDIGTTTVVATLVDLRDGRELASMSCLNGQKAFGQDVITRIHYAMTQPKGTRILQQAILRDLRRLFSGLLRADGRNLSPADLYAVTVGGNNTMIHLLAGRDPSSMGQVPYRPAFTGALTLSGAELDLPVSPACQVYCLPAVSAYVGGDITAGVLDCDLMGKTDKNILFIDIGTNGEMVLSRRGTLCACSCAAGPALEGMNISCGVRASQGAIEDVAITMDGGTPHVACSTIGDASATGLCGSGLLSAIAELRRAGLLHKTGRLLDSPLTERVAGKKTFVLDAEHNIRLTQQDIRQVQLAKGAILSGIQSMMEHNGISAGEIDEVLVAGQFGAHLKADSLTGAGLIPAELEQAVRYVGNTSKSGAYLTLLSQKEREHVETIARQIDYIELSTLKDYDQKFVAAINFA
jgi:uncharacterized 2Fe-2S/4Fe-4S cluster protein (DUF4445 family)